MKSIKGLFKKNLWIVLFGLIFSNCSVLFSAGPDGQGQPVAGHDEDEVSHEVYVTDFVNFICQDENGQEVGIPVSKNIAFISPVIQSALSEDNVISIKSFRIKDSDDHLFSKEFVELLIKYMKFVVDSPDLVRSNLERENIEHVLFLLSETFFLDIEDLYGEIISRILSGDLLELLSQDVEVLKYIGVIIRTNDFENINFNISEFVLSKLKEDLLEIYRADFEKFTRLVFNAESLGIKELTQLLVNIITEEFIREFGLLNTYERFENAYYKLYAFFESELIIHSINLNLSKFIKNQEISEVLNSISSITLNGNPLVTFPQNRVAQAFEFTIAGNILEISFKDREVKIVLLDQTTNQYQEIQNVQCDDRIESISVSVFGNTFEIQIGDVRVKILEHPLCFIDLSSGRHRQNLINVLFVLLCQNFEGEKLNWSQLPLGMREILGSDESGQKLTNIYPKLREFLMKHCPCISVHRR